MTYWQGKRRSEETKEKIRKTLQKLYADPKDHPQYKGEIKRSGYLYIKDKNHPHGGKQNYVAVHRLIMEKHLGRYLLPKEVVHHINSNITDNRLENLELHSSPGQHTKNRHPDVFKKASRKLKGRRLSPATEFKKGNIPWNKK